MADRPELDDFWLTVRLSASLLGCALLLLLRVPILRRLGWCVGYVAALFCAHQQLGPKHPASRATLGAKHPLREAKRDETHGRQSQIKRERSPVQGRA